MSAAGVLVVAEQEFRLRIRAGRWKALLVAWVLLLGLLTAGLRLSAGTVDRLADRGTIVYGGLVLLVLGLALLVVPSLAAQSVNGDRERGTLAALQVTRLSAAEITLGKFAAAWGTALLFVLLSLPMALYAVTQGGVTARRVLVVYAVLGLLVGVVCALSLLLSALLSRTSTSGVLAYLTVAALTVGTLLAFGAATLSTQTVERRTGESIDCSGAIGPREVVPPSTVPEGCSPTPYSFTTRTAHPERTWWLLAPNPFVVLADAAPALPPAPRYASDEQLQAYEQRRSLDPLGQLGAATRQLRNRPGSSAVGLGSGTYSSYFSHPTRKLVWPYGLGFDVALGGLALWLTARRLHTPSRTLPRGQRVA